MGELYVYHTSMQLLQVKENALVIFFCKLHFLTCDVQSLILLSEETSSSKLYHRSSSLISSLL